MPHLWLLSALCIDLFKEFHVTELKGYLIITKFQYSKPGYNFMKLKFFLCLRMQWSLSGHSIT
jgi:hypothetical protein